MGNIFLLLDGFHKGEARTGGMLSPPATPGSCQIINCCNIGSLQFAGKNPNLPGLTPGALWQLLVKLAE
jgi:hypothetical protein